jgi:hypothetical protein
VSLSFGITTFTERSPLTAAEYPTRSATGTSASYGSKERERTAMCRGRTETADGFAMLGGGIPHVTGEPIARVVTLQLAH